MIFNAVGGGTGSGLGRWRCKRLSVEYGKKSKLSFTARADIMAEAPSRVREAATCRRHSCTGAVVAWIPNACSGVPSSACSCASSG